MALDRLAAAVPPHVRDVCTRLTEAGHQAVVVGGCVRDVLMGRMPMDWDVATSARPEEVLALFKRTRPQGLQHGTVVVEMGRHKDAHIEVTTFRGEGAYSDARRPDSVTFGVPLTEDLARRDLVVNAIAYDPAKNELLDPFDGQGDIAKRRLRAVGRAVDRFTEDGLRVMRAVRFAAQLEFELDPETEAGIPPALPSLEKVSRERVCEELRKLLKSSEPSRGLRPAWRTGIVNSILPALAARIADVDPWVARIDRAAPEVRIAAMFVPLGDPKQAGDILRALKFSNAEADVAQALLGIVDTARLDPPSDEGVRRLLARVDKAKRPLAVELWSSAYPAPQMIVEVARRILDENHPLAVGDLAVTGKDLMTALSMKPGPTLGRILERLRDFVLVEPARNTREVLLAEAQRLELEVGH
jgi:tRNA nucleotidyltransferase (CCA-adding enzyme)